MAATEVKRDCSVVGQAVHVSTPPPASSARVRVDCHLCGGADEKTFLEARGYRVAQCCECGLRYVNPQPTTQELIDFYTRYDDGDQWREGEESFNRGVRDAILRFRNSGSVLDIGAGSGNFLDCMKKAGFSTFGVEPSETGSNYARTHHGIEVFHGMLDDYLANGPRQSFDVITLLNVLEHFTEPKKTLDRLRPRMNDGGLLVVVVPDARFHACIGAIRSRLGSSDPYWLEQPKSFLSGFKFPDHLTSFEPRTLRLFLEGCGFSVKRVGHAPVVLNPQFHRNVAKLAIRSCSGLLHWLTFRRLLFGYSTLAVARKK